MPRGVPREAEREGRPRGPDAGRYLPQATGPAKGHAVDGGEAVAHLDQPAGLQEAAPPVRASREGLDEYLLSFCLCLVAGGEGGGGGGGEEGGRGAGHFNMCAETINPQRG